MNATARIFVADRAEVHSTLLNSLTGYEVVTTDTFETALERLTENFDLIICGVHFADSRMVDLLSAARRSSLHKHTPFVVFRGLHTDNVELLRRSIKPLIETFELGPYLEFDSFNKNTAGKDLRERIEKLLPSAKVLPALTER
jgi:CheY-like chemotaxis protein